MPDDQRGERAREVQALVPSNRRFQGNDDVQTAAAGRLDEAFQVNGGEKVANQPGRADHVTPVDAFSRVEIDDHAVRPFEVGEAGIPGVHFEDVHLHEADERLDRVGDQIFTEFRLLLDPDASQRRRRPDLRMLHVEAVSASPGRV